MRISRKRSGAPDTDKKYRINRQITSPQVRLIDEYGENVGVVDTARALADAQEKGLDLIEVSPLANPPVAKIVDYSKLRYEEQKAKRKEKSHQKKIEIKGIRLSLRISEHDKQVRVKQALKFLEQGNKVKLEILLRGREKQHFDLAREIINTFVKSVNESTPAGFEQPTKTQGGKLHAIIAKQ